MAGASRLDNIRAVYGPAVAKELSPLDLAGGPEPGPELGPEDGMAFRMQVGDPVFRVQVGGCMGGMAFRM